MKLDELKIYKDYVDMIYYILNLLKKYPKRERFALASDIKNTTYKGLRDIIKTYKAYDKKEKNKYLNEFDEDLKVLKVLIEISSRSGYITLRNYISWNKKITNIEALMTGWIKWVKQ